MKQKTMTKKTPEVKIPYLGKKKETFTFKSAAKTSLSPPFLKQIAVIKFKMSIFLANNKTVEPQHLKGCLCIIFN